ncbi:MAG: ABC transporter permease, partial [Chitinispirillia bacterium]
MKFISFRYMTGKSKGRISFKITVACLIGIFIGTAFLVIALSIGSGYEEEIRKNIVGLLTHGQVCQYFQRSMTGYDTLELKIKKNENIISTAPFLRENVAIEANNFLEFVLLLGVTEEYLFRTSVMHEKIIKGSCNIDSTKSDRNRYQKSIVIGKELAEKMNIDTGMEIFLGSLLSSDIGSTGNQNIMRFAVSGIFETGMYEYDLNVIFISLPYAQDLMQNDGVSGIMIKTCDFTNVDEIFKQLLLEIGGYPHTYHTYISQNKSLFQWIKIQKYITDCILFLIIF